MSYEEDRRIPYKARCCCGRGFVRYYEVSYSNDWGQTRESIEDISICCEKCAEDYDCIYIGWSYYLVPKEQVMPREPNDLDRKYRYTEDEIFIGSRTKQEVGLMILDMKAHTYMKQLENKQAIEFAERWASRFRKKSLKPMISKLEALYDRYEQLLDSYNKKKPYYEKHKLEQEEWQKKRDEILENSFELHFVHDYEEEKRKEQDALLEREKHKYDPFVAKVIYDDSYKKDYCGLFWDSYYIEKCTNQEHLTLDKPVYGEATIVIAKKYQCVCSICGRSTELLSSDFKIGWDDEQGFFPKVHCQCHKVSSFEAKTMDILNGLGIRYSREVTFEGLNGNYGKPLRFDFGIYKEMDTNGKPIYDLMIELQGPHHYKEGYYDEFGDFVEAIGSLDAEKRYSLQVDYDKKKEEYCLSRGIRFSKIKYTTGRDYDKLEKQLIDTLKESGYSVFERRTLF